MLSQNALLIQRFGIVIILAVDLLHMGWEARTFATDGFLVPHEHYLYPLATEPALLWSLVAIGLFGLGMQLGQRTRVLWGLVSLFAVCLVFGLHAYLRGQNDESTVQAGAVWFGWLFGVIIGRVTERVGTRVAPEQVGAVLAASLLGATYTAAAVSKLGASGIAWADASLITSIMGMFYQTVEPAWVSEVRVWVIERPLLCGIFAWSALSLECVSFLYGVGLWFRLIVGTGLLGMHAGMFLLTGIMFVPGVMLLLLLTYPWERFISPNGTLVKWLDRCATGPVRAARASTVGGLVTLIGLSSFVVMAAPADWRAQGYIHPQFAGVFERNRAHNAKVFGAAGHAQKEPTTPVAEFGPLHAGQVLGGQWKIGTIELSKTAAIITVVSRYDHQVVWDLRLPDEETMSNPWTVPGIDFNYRRPPVPFEAFGRAMKLAADLLVKTTQNGDAKALFEGWMRDAPRLEAPPGGDRP